MCYFVHVAAICKCWLLNQPFTVDMQKRSGQRCLWVSSCVWNSKGGWTLQSVIVLFVNDPAFVFDSIL